MNNLIMNPNELTACADRLRAEAGAQMSIYNSMRTLLTQLRGDWLGSAYEGLLETFFEQEQVMREYTDLMKEYASLLNTTGVEFERMDSDAVRFFSNID